jgi:hypothetical protein
VTRYMSCAIELRDELVQVRYDVSDKDVIHTIFIGLPDDYDTIVTVLIVLHELDLGAILEQLVNQEEELKSKEIGTRFGSKVEDEMSKGPYTDKVCYY